MWNGFRLRCGVIVYLLVQVSVFGLKINTDKMRFTDFSDGTKDPYFNCTTQRPAYVEVVEVEGQNAVKMFWTERGYDGTRMDKGAEACSKLEIYKEGWQAYKVYLPDPGFPKNKTGSISQIFSMGGCSSWASMLVVVGNKLEVVHRDYCGNADEEIISNDIPRNRWIQVIMHFRVSQNNDGFLKVWFDSVDKENPTYEHIGDFGFGYWRNDVLIKDPPQDPSNFTDLKFGMYNHNDRDYDDNEERWLYYDDVANFDGNPEGAFEMAQGKFPPGFDGVSVQERKINPLYGLGEVVLENLRLSLYSIQGELLKEIELGKGDALEDQNLLKGYKQGLYFLRVESSRETFTQKYLHRI